jgi:hypothetical protein
LVIQVRSNSGTSPNEAILLMADSIGNRLWLSQT